MGRGAEKEGESGQLWWWWGAALAGKVQVQVLSETGPVCCFSVVRFILPGGILERFMQLAQFCVCARSTVDLARNTHMDTRTHSL